MDQISRRSFTELIMTAGTGFLLVPEIGFNSFENRAKYSDNMGLQLWSVGDLLKTDLEGTLASIAEIGFKQVELPMFTSVNSIAPLLNNYGLVPTSRHFPFAFATGDWSFFPKYNLPVPENKEFESVVEDATKHGLKHLVMPYLFPEERGDINHYKTVANHLNRIGEICQKSGIQLNYHNHSFEFWPINNILPFDILKSETDDILLKFQIDVFYTYLMGVDPAKLIKNMGSRVKSLHLKDMNLSLSDKNSYLIAQSKPAHELWDETVALGTGLLDFKSILLAARENKIENCYVEVEGSQSNSIKVLEQSISFLKSLNL